MFSVAFCCSEGRRCSFDLGLRVEGGEEQHAGRAESYQEECLAHAGEAMTKRSGPSSAP